MAMIDPGIMTKVGLAVYDNRAPLSKMLAKLRSRILKGDLRIVVFGCGGAGKSTLGEVLSQDSLRAAAPRPYTTTLGIDEQYKLPGDLVGAFRIAPGQPGRVAAHWPDLSRSLAEGKSHGVINVVSYGYHAMEGVPFDKTRYFTPGMTPEQFVPVYTDEGRKLEMQMLQEILPGIRMAKKKIWMATIVTKQDLWWKQREEVQAHYMEGDYGAAIEKLYVERGRQNFTHEYLSASLVLSNFVDGSRTLMHPTTEGYDQNIQVAYLANLVEKFTALAKA